MNEIKSWQWQYLSVRYEEQEEEQYCDDDLHQSLPRKLPIDFIELGDKEDSMSKLAQYCRDAGLEHMFLACLKLSSTNDKKSTTTTSTIMGRKDGVEHDTTTTTPTNVTTTTMTTTTMMKNIKAAPSYGVFVQVDHMNDRKRYHRSLQRICDSSKCLFFIRHCLPTMTTTSAASSSTATLAAGIKNPRHVSIFVGIMGDKDGVKNVLKQWRTSRVDVNSKNKPCLERMMTVLMEGVVVGVDNNNDDVVNGSGLDCSLDELKELITTIYGNDWVKAINHI